MGIFDKAKDASVQARRRDEHYHARAMHEIQSGMRRDGLWAKAIAVTGGDEHRAKIEYLKLLVQALMDDDYTQYAETKDRRPQLDVEKAISMTVTGTKSASRWVGSKLAWTFGAVICMALILGIIPSLANGSAGLLSWLLFILLSIGLYKVLGIIFYGHKT